MAQEIRTGVTSTLLRGDLRELLGRHADVALAALVVLIVGMMIVPLPTFLLDVLISTNIAVGVLLLLVAIYVSDALKIATFPTLLLLTTLFRLALEVSATRLILLEADAGEVIHAFGNFVVAGNLVVGAVIFVILTLYQFIVISKGSERVAEVGARFTLDAMPGKQMSIDAELRAGHIDHTEARHGQACPPSWVGTTRTPCAT
jgi:type III secretion protein V